MKLYTQGHIFGAHMQASYHNITILEESGIGRVTVLLRDPRDAFVSWYIISANSDLPARNYHSRSTTYRETITIVAEAAVSTFRFAVSTHC